MKWYRSLTSLALAFVLVAGLSCSSDSPLGPSEEQQQATPSFGLIGDLTNTVGGLTKTVVGTLGEVTDLLVCERQPYIKQTATIGEKGGTINIGDHTLVIPRGALDHDVTITAEQISGVTNSLRFSPEGLRFETPAALSMSYDNCSVVLFKKKIVYTTENLKILEVLKASLDLFKKKTVSAPIDHFSRYAVAW